MKECQLDISIEKYNQDNHYSAIHSIDQICMQNPWEENDFDLAFDDSLSFTFVATLNDRIIGFVICDIDDMHEEIHVLRIAVLPKYQRCGVGTSLIQIAIDNLRHDFCWELIVAIDDEVEDFLKVAACNFFKSCDMHSNFDEMPLQEGVDFDDITLMYSHELGGHEIYRNRIKNFPFK